MYRQLHLACECGTAFHLLVEYTNLPPSYSQPQVWLDSLILIYIILRRVLNIYYAFSKRESNLVWLFNPLMDGEK